MMHRLSGWQRLGLIISVFWIVGSFFAIRFWEYNEAVDYASTVLSRCTAADRTFDECYASTEKWRLAARTIYWPNIFLGSLVPVPLLWLVGWGILKMTHWVKAGFAT